MLTRVALGEKKGERSAKEAKKEFKMFTPGQLDQCAEDDLQDWLGLTEDEIRARRTSTSPMKKRRV
jgi:hypothetical protein